MPRRDGTGPAAQGTWPGRGFGLGKGAGMGLGGNCLCPKCGNKNFHFRGIPCNTMKCSKCGTTMVRE